MIQTKTQTANDPPPIYTGPDPEPARRVYHIHRLDMDGLQAFNLGFNFGCGVYLAAFVAWLATAAMAVAVSYALGVSLLRLLVELLGGGF
jgi:hypothetical protein